MYRRRAKTRVAAKEHPQAGLNKPASGHIERFGTYVYVAQQQDISLQTTLAELLGYNTVFTAHQRIDSGDYQPEDLDEPTNHLDLASVQAIEAAWVGFPDGVVIAFKTQAPAGAGAVTILYYAICLLSAGSA